MSLTKALTGLARWPIVALCGLLTVLFLLYFSATERAAPEGTAGVIELELAFTEARFNGIVDQWAEAGTLGVQQRNLWLDLLFPFAYAGLLTGLLGMLALRSSGEPQLGLSVLVTLPLVAGVLDWIENGLLIWLLGQGHYHGPILVFLMSSISLTKWLLLLVSGVAIIYHLVKRIIAGRLR
jgi:hypothetical protein